MGTTAAVFVVLAVAAWLALPAVWGQGAVRIKVRWKPDVTDAQRAGLETRFHLTVHEHDQATTWTYNLLDPSTDNIERIVRDDAVDDTAHVNRIKFRPELRQDRTRQAPFMAVAIGILGALAAFVLMRP